MNSVSPGTKTSWLSALVRRHPAAALPAGSALSEPPEGLDLETAKAALEQVNKRLEAELSLKSSTETRALTLAGQCTTLLSAITAALLVEAYGSHRAPLMAAGVVGVICLLSAVIFAYSSAKPQKTSFLPGRLPDELWDDLVAPDMKGPEFMGRLIIGSQDAMAQNELNQDKRARKLANAIRMVKLTVPLAIAAALVAQPVTDRSIQLFTASRPAVGAAAPSSSPTPSTVSSTPQSPAAPASSTGTAPPAGSGKEPAPTETH